MTSWIGADTAELRALGDTFTEQAGLLDLARTVLDNKMTQLSWHGTDLETFHTEWTSSHKISLAAAATLLRDEQAKLSRNADDQDRASNDNGDGTVAGAPGGPAGPTGPPGKAVGPKLDYDSVKDGLQEVLLGTPVQQQEWWDSLSEKEQNLLMAKDPSLVAALADGVLSEEEAAKVTEILLDKATEDTTVSKTVSELSIEGKVNFITFGAAGSMEIDTKADGSVSVTLTGELALGTEFGDDKTVGGSLTVTGGASTTYEFATQAEADAFLESMMYALVPEWEGEEAIALVTNTYVAAEYLEVLGEYSENYKETTVQGSVDGKVSIKTGVADFEINGGVEAKHNIDSGENTYTLSIEGSADVDGAGGSLGVSAALQVDKEGTLTKLTLTADASVSASGELKVPFGPDYNPQLDNQTGGASSAATGSASLEVNLENPVNQVLAAQYVEAAGKQDLAAMSEIAGQFVHDSQVTLQVGMESKLDGGVDLDLKAVEIKAESTLETNTTWVKVPGSNEYVQVATGSGKP